MSTARPWPNLERAEFRFTVPSRNFAATLLARVAYCQPIACPDGDHAGRFITGFKFEDTDVRAIQRQIREIVAQVTLTPA